MDGKCKGINVYTLEHLEDIVVDVHVTSPHHVQVIVCELDSYP